MDYFLKYLSTPQTGQSPSGAETVEKLTDRVNSSTLLEDRRDAVRALRSLAKKFRYEVGTKSMQALINVIKTDKTDSEILGYALDTLQILLTVEEVEPDDDEQQVRELVSQLANDFLKDHSNISLLLSVLQEYDYHILLSTVRLLTGLLLVKTKQVQEIVLTNPMGISRLMDLLADAREIIRNEDLLLLRELTKGNSNIQKIVAFENAFERLFDIIKEEGYSEGGIIVEDCLLLLLNLLCNNFSNQNFLKEGSYIQHIAPFFVTHTDTPAHGWPQQKVANTILMLKLIRTLVSPNNPPLQTSACQKSMFQCGLLERLCELLLMVGVPEEVLVACISSVAEVLRGCLSNQEYFASVMAPSSPPRALVVVLLMSMISETQSFKLRCAILHCFQSFLYKNELGQSQIVQTLLPSSSEVNQLSAGQLLCVGMFSQDVLSTWCCCMCLLHTIINNNTQKEQLLRVQLASSLGNSPTSLITQATHVLTSGAKFQTRVGLLQLLCHWMEDCPHAVTYFLRSSSSVPYLISQVSACEGDEDERIMHGLCAFLLGLLILFNNNQVPSYHKNDLRQIIEKRIGFEQYTDKLNQVSKHEAYSRAVKSPHPTYNNHHEALFDHQFAKLFRKLEGEVIKALTANESEQEKKDQHDNVLEQYKNIIREQDVNLNKTTSELRESQQQLHSLHTQLQDATSQIQFLKDQNALLKVQTDSKIVPKTTLADPATPQNDLSEELLKQLQAATAEAASYKRDYEAVQQQISQLSMNAGSCDNVVNNELMVERNNLSLKISQLQESNEKLSGENEEVKRKLQEVTGQLESSQAALQKLESDRAESDIDKMAEIDSLKKEQEDLLLLLSDQDATINTYRSRLKQLGEEIEDEENEDEVLDGEDEEYLRNSHAYICTCMHQNSIASQMGVAKIRTLNGLSS